MSKVHRSRAPLRLGLGGGGTDVSPYSDEFGGCVLNATINLFSYCSIYPRTDSKICFRAADQNQEVTLDAPVAFELTGTLALHKAVYNRVVREFNDSRPLACDMVTYSDALAGSGLGTSSTMVVAIIAAFTEWLKLPLGEYETAHLAYEIERLELGLSGGKQDQYAAAFGGFNFMEFQPSGHVVVNPLRIKPNTINELQSSIVLYYTGVSRDSAKIISEQINNVATKMADSVNAMHRVKADAILMKEYLLRGNLSAFTKQLGRSWESKKRMASVISNAEIDRAFDVALSAGARAGKVSGAGGGGYIMFMIDPNYREEVTRALSIFTGAVHRFQFTSTGVETWSVHRQ